MTQTPLEQVEAALARIVAGDQDAYDDLIPLTEVLPQAEFGLAGWVHRMLALDPQDRPGSARAALAER